MSLAVGFTYIHFLNYHNNYGLEEQAPLLKEDTEA